MAWTSGANWRSTSLSWPSTSGRTSSVGSTCSAPARAAPSTEPIPPMNVTARYWMEAKSVNWLDRLDWISVPSSTPAPDARQPDTTKASVR